MIYSIYLITNKVNNKVYVGFSANPQRRWSGHKCAALTTKRPNKFYKAIRKYGWENFTKEIICQSKDYNHLLSEMEPYFIKKYNSYKNGYNMTIGGNSGNGEYKIGFKHKRKSIAKMSKTKRLKYLSGETVPVNRKQYILISPKNETFIINGSLECLKYGISPSAMKGTLYTCRPVSRGKHKGWQMKIISASDTPKSVQI